MHSTSSADPLALPLKQGLDALNLPATPEQIQRLLDYLRLIAQWNKVYNLTAVRDPQEMLSLHLLDSLAAIAPLRRHTQGQATTLLDVGAGAGLPGVVIAIMCPEVSVTCIDTVAKKVAFLTQVGATLKLPNFAAVHNRVENWNSQGFDVVTSRAFASLADFTKWTLFHVKQTPPKRSGVWMALKGKTPDDEIESLPGSVRVTKVEVLQVPGLDASRCIVWMEPRDADSI